MPSTATSSIAPAAHLEDAAIVGIERDQVVIGRTFEIGDATVPGIAVHMDAIHVGPLEIVVECDVFDGEFLEIAQLRAEGDRVLQGETAQGETLDPVEPHEHAEIAGGVIRAFPNASLLILGERLPFIVHVPHAADQRDVLVAAFVVVVGDHHAVAAIFETDHGEAIQLKRLVRVNPQRLG